MELKTVEILDTSQLNIVGIGKFVPVDRPWKFSHLHFVVNYAADGMYEAVNMELCLVAFGKTEQEAVESLIERTDSHLSRVLGDQSLTQKLLETVQDHSMDDFWRHYRLIEMRLGLRGDDVGTQIHQNIAKAIEEKYAGQRKQLEEQVKQLATSLENQQDQIDAFKELSVNLTRALVFVGVQIQYRSKEGF